MDEDTRKARRKLFSWAIGLNVLAWGGYFYLTQVMGFDLDALQQARHAG